MLERASRRSASITSAWLPSGNCTICRAGGSKIHSEEDLVIEGQVEGKLDLGRNRLVVGPNGNVRADIGAREVDVQGVVNENVEAAERIALRKNSKMVGDLKMASVVIEDGAYFNGSIDITRSQDTHPVAPAVVAKPPALPNAG